MTELLEKLVILVAPFGKAKLFRLRCTIAQQEGGATSISKLFLWAAVEHEPTAEIRYRLSGLSLEKSSTMISRHFGNARAPKMPEGLGMSSPSYSMPSEGEQVIVASFA